jgi:hypothetical protein
LFETTPDFAGLDANHWILSGGVSRGALEHIGSDGAFLQPLGAAIELVHHDVMQELFAAVGALEVAAGEHAFQFLKNRRAVTGFFCRRRMSLAVSWRFKHRLHRITRILRRRRIRAGERSSHLGMTHAERDAIFERTRTDLLWEGEVSAFSPVRSKATSGHQSQGVDPLFTRCQVATKATGAESML